MSTQESYGSVVTDDASGHCYTRIRPDLVVVEIDSGRTVPIDIKYKLYSTKKFSPADMYQTFLYAYALSTDAEHARAGLIYPSTRMTDGPGLRVNRAAGTGLEPSLCYASSGGAAEQQWRHARRQLLGCRAS